MFPQDAQNPPEPLWTGWKKSFTGAPTGVLAVQGDDGYPYAVAP